MTTYLKGNYRLGAGIIAQFDKYEVLFDGILGDSKETGNLIPIAFVNRENIKIADKMQLAFCARVLGSNFKATPSIGRIIYGSNHKNLRVNLEKLIVRVNPTIENLSLLFNIKDKPSLCLNKHCQICEFYPSCLKTAKDNDHLSLISGLDSKSDERRL